MPRGEPTTITRPLQVHAWDVQEERIVRIGPGQAEELRSRCVTGRLVCPFLDCPRPRLTTQTEYRNHRHGTEVVAVFRHAEREADALHTGESWYHLTGKLRVRDWLKSCHSTWDVEAERTVGTETTRRPDVSAITPVGGRLAIEVQYSPLTPERWAERSQHLHDLGYDPVWLWGHIGTYGPGGKGPLESEGPGRLQQLVRQSWAAGARPHWLDPERDHVLSVVATDMPEDWSAEPLLRATRLEDCRIYAGSPRGVVPASAGTWGRRRFTRSQPSLADRLFSPIDAVAVEERRRLTFTRGEQAGNRAERMHAYRKAWEMSLHRRWLISEYGEVPGIITRSTPKDDLGFRCAEEWKAQILSAIGGRVGKTIQFKHLLACVQRPPEYIFFPAPMIRAFARVLREQGFVEFADVRGSDEIPDELRVVGDLSAHYGVRSRVEPR